MNKQEYIKNIIKHIQNDSMQKESFRELSDHFEDRKQYYLDAGFEEEVAEEKTVARMGDAELIGTKMGKVHGRRFYVPVLLIELVLGLVMTPVALFMSGFIGEAVLLEMKVLAECILLLFLFLFSYIGLRYRYKSLLILACIPFVLFLTLKGGLYLYTSTVPFVSGTVWETVYLALGKVKALYEVAARSWVVDVSWWLQVLSLLFYAWIIFCAIAGIMIMVREDRAKCTLKQKKMLKLIKRSMLGMGLVILVSAGAFYAVYYAEATAARDAGVEESSVLAVYAKGIDENQSLNEMEGAYIQDDTDSFYSYVSDTKIESTDTIQLYGSGEDGEPIRRIEKKRFDNNIEYYIVIHEVNVKTTKDYMYFSNKGLWENFSKDKWTKVKKGEKYLVAFEKRADYPKNFVEFTIQ